jgi:hypothetical protein
MDLTYSALSATWSDDQKRFADRVFERAKAEIESDIARGRIGATIADLDDLKAEVGQAGAYGALWEPDVENEGARLFPPPANGGDLLGYQRACTVIHQRIHEWLRDRKQ